MLLFPLQAGALPDQCCPRGRASSVLLGRAVCRGSVPHCSTLSPGITFQRLVRTEQGLPVKNYQSSTV